MTNPADPLAFVPGCLTPVQAELRRRAEEAGSRVGDLRGLASFLGACRVTVQDLVFAQAALDMRADSYTTRPELLAWMATQPSADPGPEERA